MKKVSAVLVFALFFGLAAVEPAAGQRPDPGGFKLTVHTHSDGELLFPVDTLSFEFEESETFSYSSRRCGATARFNDVGLNFSPDYPGVDDDDGTAPVRHHVEGTVTSVDGDTGTIEGKITTVLCVPSNGTQVESEHVIVSYFQAEFQRVSDNSLEISGTFEISPTESTGTFEGLEGHGSIMGAFTCLAHQRDPSQPTCAELGEFTDFVGSRGDPTKEPGDLKPGLVGTWRDTTFEPV
jgi:hypothetical protein